MFDLRGDYATTPSSNAHTIDQVRAWIKHDTIAEREAVQNLALVAIADSDGHFDRSCASVRMAVSDTMTVNAAASRAVSYVFRQRVRPMDQIGRAHV